MRRILQIEDLFLRVYSFEIKYKNLYENIWDIQM